MSIDIARLRRPAQAIVPTSVGELAVFSQTVGGQSALAKALGGSIANATASEFMRAFVRQTCYRPQSLVEGRFRPADLDFGEPELASLTPADLDAVAKVYLEHNSYLAEKEAHGSAVPGTEATAPISPVDPRRPSEGWSECLHRLSINEERDARERIERFMENSGIMSSPFSKGLSAQIESTLLMGARLREESAALQTWHAGVIVPSPPAYDSAILLDNSAQIEARRLKPFNELATRLDTIADATARSAEFADTSNATQLGMAAEIRKSGTDTTKIASKNLNLTWVVVGVSAVGLIVALASAALSRKDAAVSAQATKQYVEQLSGDLRSVAEVLRRVPDTLVTTNAKLERSAAQQRREIADLRRQLTLQAERVRALERKTGKSLPPK